MKPISKVYKIEVDGVLKFESEVKPSLDDVKTEYKAHLIGARKVTHYRYLTDRVETTYILRTRS